MKLETSEERQLSEWQKARLGKITASQFEKVKKLKTGVWGETAMSYLYDLIGEHLSGQPSETFTGGKATQWGNMYEAEAIRQYTKRTKRKVKPGKFVPDGRLKLVGGTPDGFVGEKGLIEAKCPFNYKNHIRTVMNKTVPDEYLPQVLGNLMLTGREWCDFVSYDPRIQGPQKLVIVRVRKEDFGPEIEELATLIIEFYELLTAKLKELKIKY